MLTPVEKFTSDGTVYSSLSSGKIIKDVTLPVGYYSISGILKNNTQYRDKELPPLPLLGEEVCVFYTSFLLAQNINIIPRFFFFFFCRNFQVR